MELRKNSYDQPHSRRLDELNRLEKGQNDLNLERETDIYQFVHLVRFTDENLQRRLKKPTNVLRIHSGGCFCLLHRLFTSTGHCCIQCHSVTIPQRCGTTGNLPAYS